MVSLMSPDENSYSFLLWPKMMTATSTEHSTESSCAFLNRPPLRFRKVLARVSVGSRLPDARRREGSLHGTVAVVLDGLDLDLSAAHGDGENSLRRQGALDVDDVRARWCGWRPRVLEERDRAGTSVRNGSDSDPGHVVGFSSQREAATVGACVGDYPATRRWLYVSRNGGPMLHPLNLEALRVMCKRKPS
jgi:hypothetical protein